MRRGKEGNAFMFFDIVTVGLMALYIPVSRFLKRMGSIDQKYLTIRYYYNTIFFAVFSFFACVSLQRSIVYMKDFQVDTLRFWIGFVALFFIGYVFIRVVYEVILSFRALFRMEEKDRSLHDIVANVIRIILVFTIIYFMIYLLNPGAFRGLDGNTNSFMAFFDLIYFSIVTFATVGYGDIVPVSLTAKVAVSCQILLFYVVIGIGFVYAVKDKEK